MRAVRLWSIRHARFMNGVYRVFEPCIVLLAPVFRLIGYKRVEKPVAAVERVVKGFLFDCQMCGMCALSHTGMSCPMNCPKNLRNGPCGGVRQDGNCEVIPDMPCVWVKAWEGAQAMGDPDKIAAIMFPADHVLKDTSSWLKVVRDGTSGAVLREAGEAPEEPAADTKAETA